MALLMRINVRPKKFKDLILGIYMNPSLKSSLYSVPLFPWLAVLDLFTVSPPVPARPHQAPLELSGRRLLHCFGEQLVHHTPICPARIPGAFLANSGPHSTWFSHQLKIPF